MDTGRSGGNAADDGCRPLPEPVNVAISLQLAAAETTTTTRSGAGMKPRPTHTQQILRDDIRWLEGRIQQLAAAGDTRLGSCYQKLLHQRQHRLASRSGRDGICPGCWQDYFG